VKCEVRSARTKCEVRIGRKGGMGKSGGKTKE
jgi:hypothetical protein